MRASSLRINARMALFAFACVVVLVAGSTRSHAEDAPFVGEDNGPFMVLARIFRGPDAEGVARALVSELKQEHKLTAYIYRAFPKGFGRFDEVAVLVGDAKSREDQEIILKKVKRINPRCLADRPYRMQILRSEPRLARAVRAANPLLRPKALNK